MADPMTGPIARCPWCSADVSIPGAERCLACGAVLVGAPEAAEAEIKGVTALDPEAIARARREVARPRSRLFSFLTGETGAAGADAPVGSLSLPPDDVRREMLRLRLEAERADLVAQTIALRSDVLAELGIHVSELGGDLVDPHAAGTDAGTSAGTGAGTPDAETPTE